MSGESNLNPRSFPITTVCLLISSGCGSTETLTEASEPLAAGISLTPSDPSLSWLGETVAISAQVLDQHGNVMSGVGLTWTTSEPDVAIVSASGVVTAVGNGAATITASAATASGEAVVSVDQEPNSIVISPSLLTFYALGDTSQLSANVLDAGGSAISPASAIWIADDPSVAAVSADGLVTAVGFGSTTVLSESGNASASVGVEVSDFGRIVWAKSSSTNPGNIWVMRPDGGGQVQLTFEEEEDGKPTWSPDGSRIAFDRFSTSCACRSLLVMNADGSGQDTLVLSTISFESAGDPSWSPDGSRIAFVSNRDNVPDSTYIYVVDADGSNLTRITRGGRPPSNPDWSPDGSRLAFVAYPDTGGTQAIHLMDPDGSNVVQLTDGVYRDTRPSWSPDGAKIAFTGQRNPTDIFIMDADGSTVTNLTDELRSDFSPTWAPDGSQILFQSVRDGNDLWIMNSDGSNPVQLTSDSPADQAPEWYWPGR